MKIDELIEKYPYYVVPFIEEYRKTDVNSEEGKKLCRIIAANIGDRKVLRRILGMDSQQIDKICSDETKSLSTFEAIDSFLEKFGKKPEEPVKELLKDIPSGQEEYVTEDNFEEGDNDEVKGAKNAEESEEIKEEETDRNTLRHLILERKYEEALEIIERQNLNNKEKNIYFADQIRFLRKLIELKKTKQIH